MPQSTDPFELFDELLHAHREPDADVDLRRPAAVTRVPDQLEDLFDLLPTLPPASGRASAVPDRPGPRPVAVSQTPPAPALASPSLPRTTPVATPPQPDISDRDREIRAIVAAAETQIAALRAQLQNQRRPRARSTIALVGLTSLLLAGATVVVLSRLDELPQVPNPASIFGSAPAKPSASAPEPTSALEPAEGPVVTPPERSPAPVVPAGTDSPRAPSAPPRPTATSGQSSEKPASSLPLPSEKYLTRDAELVMQVKPEFPEGARERREIGLVEVDITIDDQGRVAQAGAISGPETLRAAAETAARRWRFKPALRVGQPIESRRRVVVIFE